MAKTYTRLYYDQPSISLSLVSGGSLAANTTYYYRAMTSNGYYGSTQYVSKPSAVQSITTTSTHKSIKIDITHATGNAEYTFIWVHEGADPGTGNWTDIDNFPNIYQLGTSSTSILATSGTSKITTYTDTGARYTYMRLGTTNYGMYLLHENAQDRIEISGGTAEDPVTLEDIYQYALANGWPVESTIDRVDYGRPGAGDSDGISPQGGYGHGRPTYILNGRFFYYYDHFSIQDCNVISFARYFTSASGSFITIGEYDSTLDLSKNGVDWTSMVHGSQAGSINLRNPKIYDSKFRGRRLAASIANPYSNTFDAIAEAGYVSEIIDTTVAGDYNNGMGLAFVSTEGNVLKRVYNYENRWETTTTSAINANIEEWKLWVFNSGPWIRTSETENLETTIRDLNLSTVSVSTRMMYLQVHTIGYSFFTMLNLINPVVNESAWDQLYWYWRGTDPPDEDNPSFVKRQYTVSLQVMDEEGTPIEGATAVLTDKDGTEVFSETTDANGEIGEQVVTHTLYQANLEYGTHHYQPDAITTPYNPFTLTVTKADYNDYTHTLDIEEASSWVIGMKLAGEGYADRIDVELADTAIDVEVEDDDISLTVDDGIYLTVDDDEIDVVIDTLEITVSE